MAFYSNKYLIQPNTSAVISRGRDGTSKFKLDVLFFVRYNVQKISL